MNPTNRQSNGIDLPESTGPPALRKRRRWRRWVVLVVVLALVGWFARFAYLRITLRPTPRPVYWEAQLAALDPPPPGAISADAAERVLVNRPWEGDPVITRAFAQRDVTRVLRGPWDEARDDVAAVTAVFESQEFKDARAALARAAEAGWRDEIELTPDAGWSPQSILCYRWAKWLAVHSRWSVGHNGDVEAAIEDWLITLRTSRQLRRSGPLIGLLVDNACTGLVASEMTGLAADVAAPVDTCSLVAEIDRIRAPEQTARELVAGEYILTMSDMEHFYVREGGNWLDVSAAAAQTATFQRAAPPRPPSRLWNLASPIFHDFPTACRALEDAMTELEHVNTLVAAQETIDSPTPVGPGPLDGLESVYFFGSYVVSVAQTLGRHYQTRCQLDASLTLLALREFNRQRGRYPETLDELLPDYLPRLPIDYADRQPLRYRLTDDGFLLYSIGLNGQDDGGQCTNSDNPWDPQNADAVFSKMRRPDPFE